MSAPQNANEVALNLAKLSRELEEVKEALNSADMEAVNLREDAKLAEAKAFLSAEGAMDFRKQTAIVKTHVERLAAEVAEAKVRGLTRSMRTLQSRIDVGRSIGAGVRAEASLAGYGGGA
ncbi:hypothetical protein 7S2_27 [uncultured Caudovirales phage]|uniref:Uncharacterized protein n=1 Tax=uncultured Caudovirales phage TaxID=2100421 RepID=A0A2H4J9V0_9CAUD|nr:hypothetical protein 7S2_27 [uncultured Caudovirales phage]